MRLMTVMTLELPDELVRQIEPVQHYLPTILQLNFTNFQTPAEQTAREIIHFLTQNPAPLKLLNYHVPERAQNRLRYLLDRNREQEITSAEEAELDELIVLERIARQIKMQAAKQLRQHRV